MSFPRVLFIFTAFSITTGVARAQYANDADVALASSSILSTTIGVPLTGLGFAIYGLITTAQNNKTPAPAAEAYLRENTTQLIVDLTAGDGPTLRDFARVAEIDAANYARFASRLRAHRTELLDLADIERLDEHRAVAFLERIGELVKSDESLAQNYRAFLARHSQEG